jgi:hypothetical protein
MMEAVSTSKTSVIFYETTRRNILEDSHLHISQSSTSQKKISYVCDVEI